MCRTSHCSAWVCRLVSGRHVPKDTTHGLTRQRTEDMVLDFQGVMKGHLASTCLSCRLTWSPGQPGMQNDMPCRSPGQDTPKDPEERPWGCAQEEMPGSPCLIQSRDHTAAHQNHLAEPPQLLTTERKEDKNHCCCSRPKSGRDWLHGGNWDTETKDSVVSRKGRVKTSHRAKE